MDRERTSWLSRSAVATLGTLPAAVLAGAALARWLPLAESTRLAIAYVATLPLWAAAMCVAFLDARAWRSALACLAVAAVLAAAMVGSR